MIKFFRKIRYNLMEQNKTGKYLKYAIGEIILVVIGILIALSINNRNEERKTRQFEITILENIQEDILADKLDLVSNLQYQKEMISNEQLLLNLLLNNQTLSLDSIDYANALGIDLITAFHNASFNNLQNNDIGLISNNNLYKKITRYYDYYSATTIEAENKNNYANTYDEKFAFFKKHFKVNDIKRAVPFIDTGSDDKFKLVFERYTFSIRNIALLKADEEFKVVLAESLFINSFKHDFYVQILDKIVELNDNIEDELILLRKK